MLSQLNAAMGRRFLLSWQPQSWAQGTTSLVQSVSKSGHFPEMSLLCIWKLMEMLGVLTEAVTNTSHFCRVVQWLALPLHLSFIFLLCRVSMLSCFWFEAFTFVLIYIGIPHIILAYLCIYKGKVNWKIYSDITILYMHQNIQCRRINLLNNCK